MEAKYKQTYYSLSEKELEYVSVLFNRQNLQTKFLFDLIVFDSVENGALPSENAKDYALYLFLQFMLGMANASLTHFVPADREGLDELWDKMGNLRKEYFDDTYVTILKKHDELVKYGNGKYDGGYERVDVCLNTLCEQRFPSPLES